MKKIIEPVITRVEVLPRHWGSDYAVYGNGLRGAILHGGGGVRVGIDCPHASEFVGLTYKAAHQLLGYYRDVCRALAFYERELEGIDTARQNIERLQASLQKRVQKAALYAEDYNCKVANMNTFKNTHRQANSRKDHGTICTNQTTGDREGNSSPGAV